jgi:integrase
MAKALTTRGIEAVKPGTTRREIPDAILPGLYLIVQRSGACSWALRYRFNGRSKKFTIGPSPAIKLAKARELGRAALIVAKGGTDPGDQKKAAKREEGERRQHTFDVVAEEFITRYLYGSDKKKPLRTADDVAAAIRRDLVPPWRKKPISTIKRTDVVELLEAIVDRGSPSVAHHTFAYARKLFRWALNRSRYGIVSSPLEGLSATEIIGRKKRGKRVLTDAEIKLAWEAAETLEYPHGPFVQMLLIKGQRLRETANATRPEFDLDETELWTVGAERMKGDATHEVPLVALAIILLKRLPRGKEGSYVFSTTDGARPISGFDKLKRRLHAAMRGLLRRAAGVPEKDVDLRKALGLATDKQIPAEYLIEPFVFNDLRRTVRTRLSGLPIPDEVRELMIAHSRPELHQVYDQHAFRDEKRRGFELWAQRLGQIINPSDADVIPIRRAAGP